MRGSMVIHELTGEECNKTRALWEEVFWEDSVRFTDYYFQHKAKLNTGYVIGEYPYHAMLFRTPYLLQIGDCQKEISYIVGVATRKEYRKQGLMRTLLKHAFEKMYQEKQPFTFLMPANPAIYEPFDFGYVYHRDQWEIREMQGEIKAAQMTEKENSVKGDMLHGIYRVSYLRETIPQLPIFEMLADFANSILKENYTVYVRRDAIYYERQLEESKAQNGDIFVYFQNGGIQGFYLYAKEDGETFVQELLKKNAEDFAYIEKTGQKPIIMARIIHLEEMLKLVKTNEKKEVILRVDDPLIKENNGIYRWKMGPWGSSIERLMEEKNVDYHVHIAQLAPLILKKVFINEIV